MHCLCACLPGAKMPAASSAFGQVPHPISNFAGCISKFESTCLLKFHKRHYEMQDLFQLCDALSLRLPAGRSFARNAFLIQSKLN
jgi:hypothetical protein